MKIEKKGSTRKEDGAIHLFPARMGQLFFTKFFWKRWYTIRIERGIVSLHLF
jgi:hypothetical protein